MAGSALAVVGLGAITYALIAASEVGGGSALVVAAGVVGALALAGFVVAERRASQPMLPLSIFASRQFTGANLVTFVVYAALGGVFFLLVVFLQVALGYSPIAAGAASLPVTLLMFTLSAKAGDLAQRIGPRIPLTAGPLVVAAGMLMYRGIQPGDDYVTGVLPGVIVFGLGLSLVVAPVTATVLAAADPRHAGVALGVNNAVARTGGLLAVAVLPLVAGLSGSDYEDPIAMTEGFHAAMLACAVLSMAGSAVAFATIRTDVLQEAEQPGREPCAKAIEEMPRRHCAVDGTPVVSGGDGSETVSVGIRGG